MKEYDKKVLAMDGVLGGLLIAFIILKVIGAITWNWFWVLCPIWLPFAFLFGALAIVFAGVCVFGLLSIIAKRAKI